MQTIQSRVEGRDVVSTLGAPVMEARLECDAVGETMSNAEASTSLQLGEHDDDLSVERRNTVHCPQLCSGGHNIVRLVAITPHLTHLCDHGSYLTVLMLLLDVL